LRVERVLSKQLADYAAAVESLVPRSASAALNVLISDYFCRRNIKYDLYMTQEYARATVAMPENEEKQPVRQKLAYEIENHDINDEFTVKF